MTLFGHDAAGRHFLTAARSGRLHHAWLLTGPSGVGKATFARTAAAYMLDGGADRADDAAGMDIDPASSTARLIAAESHPDFRWLRRLENDSGKLARNISVDQIRAVGRLLAETPSISQWRAVIVDAADDLEKGGANALLKMLEEPPVRTIFFLISHAPGRLLPTVRSRCRRLDFAPLDDEAMTSALRDVAGDLSDGERAALIPLARGSVGAALAHAGLDLGSLRQEVRAILRDGDPHNQRRSSLATALGKKDAADRYATFLTLVSGWIAEEAVQAAGERRLHLLDAYAAARDKAASAQRLSLDPAATAFLIGDILAAAAPSA